LQVWTLATGSAKDRTLATRDATYRELVAKLTKQVPHPESARLELDYWHDDRWGLFSPPVRRWVRTKDGKTAEVILLDAPCMSNPGTDFSMAFLLVDKRVVDCVSCWTYSRTANQSIQLEDVDGDGHLDLAFRYKAGWWGAVDARKHQRPGDKRRWLYAYTITSTGFRSLFPETDRDLRIKLAYDPAGEPVKLRVEGLPEKVREYRMFSCIVSATNTSKHDLCIDPDEWFQLMTGKDVGWLMVYGTAAQVTRLRSGEAVSRRVHLVLDGGGDPITLRWRFKAAVAVPDAKLADK
jgi:hypothetical protein